MTEILTTACLILLALLVTALLYLAAEKDNVKELKAQLSTAREDSAYYEDCNRRNFRKTKQLENIFEIILDNLIYLRAVNCEQFREKAYDEIEYLIENELKRK